MKAFTVLVNGRKVATFGIGASGVLSAVVHWLSGHPPTTDGSFLMMLGGLDNTAGPHGEHVRWPAPPLALGDEVTIRLVEVEQVDPPSSREPSTPVSPELLAEAGIAELLDEAGPSQGGS
jgi:hypothetical protein